MLLLLLIDFMMSGADPGILQEGLNAVNHKFSDTDPKHKSVPNELDVHHFSTN